LIAHHLQAYVQCLVRRDKILREQQIHTGTVELNYAEGPASGPPFVLLHGGSARWQYGTALLHALADRWHVYAPDFRGHGRSGRVPGCYGLRDYAADIVSFLEKVVRQPAILYGHSLGGEVAIMVAAEQPELVQAVINGDAPFSVKGHITEEPSHKAQNQLWHQLAGRPVEEIALALRETPVRVPGEDAPKRAADVFGDDSPWFAFHALNLHLLDPDVLAAVLAGPEVMLDGYDPERLLPAITCPVLILQASAERSALTDAEVQMALRLLPNATVARLEGVSHELHGLPSQLPRVLEAITPFLEGFRPNQVS
jgi:pimeloyl-ACP methyl ester carboxylesterase